MTPVLGVSSPGLYLSQLLDPMDNRMVMARAGEPIFLSKGKRNIHCLSEIVGAEEHLESLAEMVLFRQALC